MYDNVKVIFKLLVMVICIVMFCVQFHHAILSLINPPTIDSTIRLRLTEVAPPIITVCPTNQTFSSRVKQLGYTKKGKMFKGFANCSDDSCLSWGHNLNITFDQLLEQIFDKKLSEKIQFSQKGIEEKVVILPRFGFCKEFARYDPTKKVAIINKNPLTAMRIFFTDEKYRSYYSLDFSSHQGNNIMVQQGKFLCINVNVNIYSSCNIAKDSTEKVDFQTCIDNKLKDDFLPMIGCVPPWMSSFDQCNDTYPQNENYKEIIFKSYNKIIWLQQSGYEDGCKSCKQMSSHVSIRDDIDIEETWGDNSKTRNHGRVLIHFDENVYITEKLYNYDSFKFIIDIGSSLGLWLGLSVFGLYDILIRIIGLMK